MFARWPARLITIGGSVFIVTLAVSAVFVPEIRWLHVFQASIYVVAIILSRRQNRWGPLIGVSAAGLWDYLGLFGFPLFADWLAQPGRPDLLLQVVAWFANLVVIIGGVWAYARRPDRARADLARWAAAFVGATTYLATAIAIFAPSYLRIFRVLIHPHWPWAHG